MYKDIFESIRNEAEKRNLRERTIQLYCSDVSTTMNIYAHSTRKAKRDSARLLDKVASNA